jgi:hypothetical protein
MSNTKKLSNITAKHISDKGVQALANRPNAAWQYGVGGLSPTQLKLWFDKLATFLADKVNEIQDLLASGQSPEYIRIPMDEIGIENLKDLFDAYTSGAFAESLLMVRPSVTSENPVSLQTAFYDIARLLAEYDERISENYIKGDKGDTGVLVMSVEGKTLILESENNLLTVEDGVLIIS